MTNTFIEFDKSGAEWVVVAYLSEDARMIEVCEKGVSPHPITGNLITDVPIDLIEKEDKQLGHLTDENELRKQREEHLPELYEGEYFIPRNMSIRQCGKKSNHGLNYGLGYRSFALYNGMEERESKKIVELYRNKAYPNIKVWWDRVQRQLNKDRTLENLFGDKRRFLDAWGSELFEAAYAYVPQSTVVKIVNMAMCKIYEDKASYMQPVRLKQQVHDSLTLQYDTADLSATAAMCLRVKEHLDPELHCNGRSFHIQTEAKLGFDLKNMVEFSLEGGEDRIREQLKEALDAAKTQGLD